MRPEAAGLKMLWVSGISTGYLCWLRREQHVILASRLCRARGQSVGAGLSREIGTVKAPMESNLDSCSHAREGEKHGLSGLGAGSGWGHNWARRVFVR